MGLQTKIFYRHRISQLHTQLLVLLGILQLEQRGLSSYKPSPSKRFLPLSTCQFITGTLFTFSGLKQRDLIIIIIVVCLVVIILVVVLVVKTMRNCRSTTKEPQTVLTQPDNMDSLGRGDTYNRITRIPSGMAPPPYGAYPQYGTPSHDMTDRFVYLEKNFTGPRTDV